MPIGHPGAQQHQTQVHQRLERQIPGVGPRWVRRVHHGQDQRVVHVAGGGGDQRGQHRGPHPPQRTLPGRRSRTATGTADPTCTRLYNHRLRTPSSREIPPGRDTVNTMSDTKATPSPARSTVRGSRPALVTGAPEPRFTHRICASFIDRPPACQGVIPTRVATHPIGATTTRTEPFPSTGMARSLVLRNMESGSLGWLRTDGTRRCGSRSLISVGRERFANHRDGTVRRCAAVGRLHPVEGRPGFAHLGNLGSRWVIHEPNWRPRSAGARWLPGWLRARGQAGCGALGGPGG
jgi:hypothetical protein